jgi:hypothetical protein
MPLSTLQASPRDDARKTRGQDGFATSFPVGLFHPLQHGGLSRRTPVCPSYGQVDPDSTNLDQKMVTTSHRSRMRCRLLEEVAYIEWGPLMPN